jgi:hypothetical protein
MSLNKLFLSTVLLLQNFTPSSVGGGELPIKTINQQWENYNDALDAKKAILEEQKIKEALIFQRKENLKIVRYKISKYLKQTSKSLYWSTYARKISHLESGGRYHVTNEFGYLGKYQISKHYINQFGYTGTKQEFLKDKLGQELVMANYTYNNLRYIKNFNLDQYIGKEINGIKITLFGMMASAHLVGIKSLTEYLDSNGEVVHKDGYDTSMEKYLKVFAQS